MTPTEFQNEKNTQNNKNADKELYVSNSKEKSSGDIDELIFPDDEPYYISQR